MKRISTEIVVRVEEGKPRLINWSGRTFVVRNVQERWAVEGTVSGGGGSRQYFRVETQRGVLLIYRAGKHWFLSRMVHE